MPIEGAIHLRSHSIPLNQQLFGYEDNSIQNQGHTVCIDSRIAMLCPALLNDWVLDAIQVYILLVQEFDSICHTR